MNETLKNILITIVSLIFIFVIVVFFIWIRLEYWQLLLIGLALLGIVYVVHKIICKLRPNSKYVIYSKEILELIKQALGVL